MYDSVYLSGQILNQDVRSTRKEMYYTSASLHYLTNGETGR